MARDATRYRDPARFSDPFFVNLRTASPATRTRLALERRAYKKAWEGDKTLAIALGLFPAKAGNRR